MNKIIKVIFFSVLISFAHINYAKAACSDDELTIAEVLIVCDGANTLKDLGSGFLKGGIAKGTIRYALNYLGNNKKKGVIKKILTKKLAKRIYKKGFENLKKKLKKQVNILSYKKEDVAMFFLKEAFLLVAEVHAGGSDTTEYVWISYLIDQAFAGIEISKAGKLWLIVALEQEAVITADQVIKAYNTGKLYYKTMKELEASALEGYIRTSILHAKLVFKNKTEPSSSNREQMKKMGKSLFYYRMEIFKNAGIDEYSMARYFSSIKDLLALYYDPKGLISDDENPNLERLIRTNYKYALAEKEDEENNRFCYFQTFMFTIAEKAILKNAIVSKEFISCK